ncbi:unnamed protein product [Paramecium primaurelia]|uniref:Uncharacterized protein n=1 Tax=Paramecium primaurelia TaxID=5886 RepID=A0A8S1NKE1_PARPR|nr:unnamed protein product [Paramecium primaurelia]
MKTISFPAISAQELLVFIFEFRSSQCFISMIGTIYTIKFSTRIFFCSTNSIAFWIIRAVSKKNCYLPIQLQCRKAEQQLQFNYQLQPCNNIWDSIIVQAARMINVGEQVETNKIIILSHK